MRLFSVCLLYLVVSCLFLHPPSAYAASGWCNSGIKTITLPIIKVASDAPIGTVLWSSDVPFSVNCGSYLFSSSDIYVFKQYMGLTGYGLEFFLSYKGANVDYKAFVATVSGNGGTNLSGQFHMELRKTGVTPTSGAASASNPPAILFTGSGLDDTNSRYNVGSLSNISFISYTCDIDTGSRSISVQLGDTREDKFTGIGTTSPNKTFNINLNCTQPSGTYNVALTFSATADSSKAPGVIALASDASAAAGVGIQLLMNGQPVSFGTALDAGVATAGATLTIPMTARYYQTGVAVKPGKANGIATFVVSYK
jgi:major type 1 subunit fimbrin (pilin)